jgi:hypothetical protein
MDKPDLFQLCVNVQAVKLILENMRRVLPVPKSVEDVTNYAILIERYTDAQVSLAEAYTALGVAAAHELREEVNLFRVAIQASDIDASEKQKAEMKLGFFLDEVSVKANQIQ